MVECEREDVILLERCVDFAHHFFEVLLDIGFTVHAGLGFHGIEVVGLLQPCADVVAELISHLGFPCGLLCLVVASVERERKKEVHIVVEEQHRVAVEETVGKLLLDMLLSAAIGCADAVKRIVEAVRYISLHLPADEEIGDYVVALGYIVAQMYHGIRLLLIVEQIEIPLYDVSGIGVLLVDRLCAQFVPNLIVLAIADVIGGRALLLVLVFNQAVGGKYVVYYLAVLLYLIHAVGQWVVANQLINDSLKHDVEVLHEQIFFLL